MYKCDVCKEEFDREDVILLCGDIECLTEEEGGSGDIDKILCWECYEDKNNIIKFNNICYSCSDEEWQRYLEEEKENAEWYFNNSDNIALSEREEEFIRDYVMPKNN